MGAKVAIVMGSQSDWPTMKHAADALAELGVGTDVRIVSAHRTPDRMYAFAKGAEAEGFEVIIAGAGGAAGGGDSGIGRVAHPPRTARTARVARTRMCMGR